MKYDPEQIVEKNSKSRDKKFKVNDKIKIDSCHHCFQASNPFFVFETDNLYVSIPQKTQMLCPAHLTILPKTHFCSFLQMDCEIISEIRQIQKRVKKYFISELKMDQVVFIETALEDHASIDCVGIPSNEETDAIDLSVFFQMHF